MTSSTSSRPRAIAASGSSSTHGPTFALGLSKRLLNRAYESSLEAYLEEEGCCGI